MGTNVCVDRHRANECDGFRWGNERKGRDDHLITGAYTQRHRRDQQSIGATGHGDSGLHTHNGS